MLTMKELYHQWSTENPYHFQQTLLKSFSGICNRFHFLCDLPCDSISQEMIDSLYSTAPDKDASDKMRYLIGRLDVYDSTLQMNRSLIAITITTESTI